MPFVPKTNYICNKPDLRYTMRLNHLFHLILSITFSLSVFPQQKCFFEHYGAEDGLPQHTIMDILQDKKDFMWFSTWNGLSRFDGYNFYTYKIQQGDEYHMRSNRLDHIWEDKYGYIWVLPYDREPHRFDSRTDKFTGIRSLKGHEDLTFIATKIRPTPSGKVWLLSDKMGTVCVTDSMFNIELYNMENKKISGNKVYAVHEDAESNSWILTDNGLAQVVENGAKLNNFFSEKEYSERKPMQNFYSAMELKDEIWFSSDKGRIWIYNKKNGQFDLLETNIESNTQDIKAINENQILITSSKDGFFIYHRPTKSLKSYGTFNLPGMRTNRIISCYIDRSKNIWFELNTLGVAKFDVKNETMKHFEMNIESAISNVFPPNFFIFEDKDDRLWVHPRGGGFSLYDPEKDVLMPFYNEPSSPSWRFSNMMHAGFSDKQGNLWLSTRSHGLEKIIFSNDVFKTTIVDSNIHSTINNDIRSVFEDSRQNLWISTKGGKVYLYDKEHNQLGYICNNGKVDFGTPLAGTTYCIMEDDKNNIWLGTKGDGVYKLIPIIGSSSYKIEHYLHSPDDLYSLSNNSVYSIFQDKKKRIWIGTYGGGLNLVDENNNRRFINYKNNLKNYPSQFGSQIRIIADDKYGNICVGTTLGLIMFTSDFNSVNTLEYKSYIRTSTKEKSLGGNDIYDICTTRKGETYIATFGGGVNKVSAVDKDGFPTEFISYTTKDGLPSDVILTMVEDNKGRLWVSTEGNLTKFDTDKASFETYSEVNRQIEGQNFSEGSRYTSKSGIVYFGYSKGFMSVDPDKVTYNTFKPYVALSSLKIANKEVPIGDDSPLKTSINETDFLKLNHKQNFISIEFVALDYVDPKRIMYAYKLDGFDEDWIVTNKQRMANYTNLSPGEYTFRVKSTNSDGVWVDNERALNIEITPSFWQTGWAYLLYFVLLVAILYIILRILFVFYRLKDKVKLEHEQTEMRTRFFIDISHEIRTPLTMIVSPVENIMEDKNTPEETKSQLKLVLKNANRMLRMINQVLDFRKIQKQKINIQETEIGGFVEDVCNSFSKTAEEKNITLHFKNEVGDEKLWIDRDNVEKMVFNLLSNAFKFSPTGKNIEVIVSNVKRDNAIAIQVKDEGKGMTKEVMNKLFTRFASFNSDKSKPSTGIGLSIVKEVADKHHAKIQVDSEVDQGSNFTVIFPKGTEHFKEDSNAYIYSETPKEQPEQKDDTADVKETATEELPIVTKDNSRQTILVVEDDTDLRRFIKTMLDPYYNIIEAADGQEGYDIALRSLPDFILSDIMMPEVDGIELLQKIRTNAETSHIPLILLTAKTNIESKLEGLDYGADDYITKPFSVKYLRARIDNIIQQRQRLYNAYTNTAQNQNIVNRTESEHKITTQDELFIKKIRNEIEKNIDNSDFLVEDLASAMAMSRTVFFKKLKSLTGLAPIEFIRDIKIKYAAKLVATEPYTIKEISFMIGISDTKYFAQCFKAVYGMTPSEYRRKMQNK